MIIEWKVSNRKWTRVEEIKLCGEFKTIDSLRNMYRKGGIEDEHGWYIVSGSIYVVKN